MRVEQVLVERYSLGNQGRLAKYGEKDCQIQGGPPNPES